VQAKVRSRYSSVAIAFHWVIGLMMIATALGGLLHESFGKEAEEPIIGLHMASGLTILVLSLARLGWRLGHRPPPLAPTLKRWEVGLAHATHWTFYLLMMVMPLSGWAMVSTSKQDWGLSVFGLFDAPFMPFKDNKPLGGIMHETHEILGFLVLGMIALHIAAAIKHHFLDGDNTVERMLPILRARRP
jgi:cytochrome b561